MRSARRWYWLSTCDHFALAASSCVGIVLTPQPLSVTASRTASSPKRPAWVRRANRVFMVFSQRGRDLVAWRTVKVQHGGSMAAYLHYTEASGAENASSSPNKSAGRPGG